jgi:hypothetical protein
MPFDQKKLDRNFNQTRGIFDKYAYATADTLAEVQAQGYFAESRFAGGDDWANGIIDVQAADGFATMQITHSVSG